MIGITENSRPRPGEPERDKPGSSSARGAGVRGARVVARYWSYVQVTLGAPCSTTSNGAPVRSATADLPQVFRILRIKWLLVDAPNLSGHIGKMKCLPQLSELGPSYSDILIAEVDLAIAVQFKQIGVSPRQIGNVHHMV